MNFPFQTFARSMLAAVVLGIYDHTWAELLAASEPVATELQNVNVVGSINKISNVPFR
ncbi:hypothetical protein [Conchiformibius steedae]|uniref:hypothetical protein n=1 Tax=Conchiformibius steedae TaxID=153493 RepID=UPI00163A9C67|nr:hypothetical protein [Conchiformibius steedae]